MHVFCRWKINRILPTVCEVASCWFNFSGSGMVCQAGLLGAVVARHKGNSPQKFLWFGGKMWGIVVHILI